MFNLLTGNLPAEGVHSISGNLFYWLRHGGYPDSVIGMAFYTVKSNNLQGITGYGRYSA